MSEAAPGQAATSTAPAADGPALTPAQIDQLTEMVFRLMKQELLTARERRGEPQRSWR
ncbi:MAG: hypothetical protein AB7T32_12495 [Dehalococcoidia bacterium]